MKKTYKSFLDKYSGTEFNQINDLSLTKQQGFQITDVSDLNDNSTKLVYLIKLDISDNCLSKLVLSKFVSLKWLNASNNMITECLLSLHKLTHLDISCNMISDFPNLSKLRNLATLNLSRNTLRQVHESDLEPVKATLLELDLSFNKIDFTVIDFINFIERLKLFVLKEFAIQGNDFLEKNSCLLKTYKTFIYATLEHVDKVNGEALAIERMLLKKNEIKQQMLFENSEATKQNLSVYKKFSDKYKDVKSLSGLTELILTSKHNFILSMVDDLIVRASYLSKLAFLDLSGNILESIELKDFASLIHVDLSCNIIKTGRFVNLPKLKEIKMNSNHLSELPLLTNCPLVSTINLDKNNLSRVDYTNLLSASHSLQSLFLRENNVAIEELLSSQLQLFTRMASIQISHEEMLRETIVDHLRNHKDYAYAVGLKINDFTLISSKASRKKQMNKMINTEAEYFNEELNSKDESKTAFNEGKRVTDLLIDVISLLEKLNKSNGNNQVIYIQFLEKVNYFFINETMYTSKPEDLDKDKELFNTILLEINELMNISPSYVSTLLNITSQFALFRSGSFSQQVFSFYQMLIGTEKNSDVVNALKIISNYLMDFQDLTLLEQMINFTQLNESLCCGFHNDNLSLKLIEYLSDDNYIIDTEDEERIKKMITLIDLMAKYFVGENTKFKKEKREKLSKQKDEFNAWVKTNYNKALTSDKAKEKLIEQSDKIDDKQRAMNNKETAVNWAEEGDDEEEDEEGIESDNRSTLSADIEENKLEPNLLIQFQFGKNLTLLESESKFMKNIPNNRLYDSVKLFTGYQNALRNEDKEATLSANPSGSDINSSNVTKPFFRSNLLNQFANAKELKQFQKMKQEIPNFQGLIYSYLFLNAIKSACFVLCTLKEMITSDLPYQKLKVLNMLELFIILCRNYKNCSLSYKELFLNCDYMTLKKKFEAFIWKLIENWVDTTDFNNKLRHSLLIDASKEDIVSFKKLIPSVMLAFGSLVLMLNQKEYKALISSDFIDRVFSIASMERVDPFLLTGICKIIHKLLCHPLFSADEFIFSKVILKVNRFKNLLDFINPFSAQFNYIIVSSLLNEEVDNSQMDFRTLVNEDIQALVFSILAIFAKIAKFRLRQFAVSSQVEEIIDDLQKSSNLYEILSRCLYIPNDIIREKSIGCFYYFNYQTITDEVVFLILDIMKNYSSVTEGKTEYILSIMYLTLNNKLMNMILTNSFSGRDSLISAVRAGVNFLFQNSNRNPKEEEEIKQKNSLTESIILFLITASGYPELFDEFYFDIISSNEHLFTRVLHNDYLNSASTKQYIPIELERTFLGSHIMLLFDTINSSYCIPPYSYPFLRLMQKGADVICNIPDYAIDTNRNDQLQSLFYQIENSIIPERKMRRITEEMLNWHSFQGTDQCYARKGTKKWFNGDNYIEANQSKSNNVLSEEKHRVRICQLSLQELIIEQRYFIILFPNLLYYLLGQSSGLAELKIEGKLKQKFDTTIVTSGDILDQYDKYETLGKVKTSFGILQYFNLEKPFTTPYSQLIYEKLKSKYTDSQSMLSMRIESIYHISNAISLKKMNKKKDYPQSQLLKGDLLHYSLYGLRDSELRKPQEETVDNPHLRSLVIAAFLRSCFGVIISPSKAIRKDFLEMLFIDDKLKQILLMVGTSLFKYNNTVKLCNFLEKVFQIEHMPIIFSISNYDYHGNSKTSLKQSEMSNRILSSLLIHQVDTPIDLMYEKNVFHIFYVVSIYFEKTIHNYKKDFFRKEKENDFIACHSLFMFLEAFIECVTHLDLKSMDKAFVYKELIGRLVTKKVIDLIMAMLDQYSHFNNYALALALSLRKAYPVIDNADDENSEEIERKYKSTIELIVHFMQLSSIANYRLIKLIGLLSRYSPSLLASAIDHFVPCDMMHHPAGDRKGAADFTHNGNQLHRSLPSKPGSSMPLNAQLEEIFRIETIAINTMSFREKKLSHNPFFIFQEICEYELFTSRGNERHDIVFLILDLTHLLLIQAKAQNDSYSNKDFYDINLLPSDSSSKPLLEVPIQSINQVVLFDYPNRVIISFDENKASFTLKFTHSFLSSIFIEKLLSIQPKIELKESQKLQSKITKRENESYQIANRKVKKVKTMAPSSNPQLEYQKFNEFYRKIEETRQIIHKDLHLENTIEAAMYQQCKGKVNLPKAFNALINHTQQKIVYISLNYLYVLSESFEQQTMANSKLNGSHYTLSECDYFLIESALFLPQVTDYLFDGFAVIIHHQSNRTPWHIAFSCALDLNLFKIQFIPIERD